MKILSAVTKKSNKNTEDILINSEASDCIINPKINRYSHHNYSDIGERTWQENTSNNDDYNEARGNYSGDQERSSGMKLKLENTMVVLQWKLSSQNLKSVQTEIDGETVKG